MKLSESLAGFILGVICLGAGLAFFLTAGREANLEQLEKTGKRVMGSVVQKAERDSTSARRGGQTVVKTYHFQVLYTVDAKLITREFEVTASAYRMHPTGAKVEVAYDPNDPETADIAGGLSARKVSSQWVRSAILGALGTFLIAYGFRVRSKTKSQPAAS